MNKKYKIFRIFGAILLALVLILGAFMYWAIGKSLPRKSSLPVHRWPTAQIAQPKTTVTIMTYNIGHGQGVKSLPTDWRGEEVTKMHLGVLAEVINRVDADFVLLQEVDLHSNRTQDINQAEFLLQRTHYPYYACAVVWDKNYLPFPFWPLEHHLGHVLAANCIFAKYPLKNHESIIFDKPESNPFWYNWGYLDRGAQKVVAQIGDKKLTLINLHLEAWEQKARAKQVRATSDWVKSLPGPLVIGGDFNALPAEACRKNQFADEMDADFRDDRTIEIFKNALLDYSETLAIKMCPGSGDNADEVGTFTFPADAPNRRLDYLFGVYGAKIVSGRVVQEAATASDHLPVLVEVAYR